MIKRLWITITLIVTNIINFYYDHEGSIYGEGTQAHVVPLNPGNYHDAMINECTRSNLHIPLSPVNKYPFSPPPPPPPPKAKCIPDSYTI